MNQVLVLLPIAIALGLAGLVAFVWSLKSGQYEDMDGAPLRILDEDNDKPIHSASRDGHLKSTPADKS